MSKLLKIGLTEEGTLEISVGLDILACAAEGSEHFDYFDRDKGIYRLHHKVVDKQQWARDVYEELTKEDDCGSNRVMKLLDEVFGAALENGSTAVEEVK